MKKATIITIFFFSFALQAQEKNTKVNTQIVEVSCGECNFGMKGKSCDLAVRIDGKTYFVDGTKIDDHGDAHAKDGFCEVIRKAEVTGEIINNRFQATTFILLPEQK
ncbi:MULTISPECIES: DUF6370 family protein [Flavobacterium]|uniref:DUF6370 family protein n=1 Tax=Flavobacterium TaxID=237 RepID=UPI002481E882|nr:MULTISPECIES: DUF6370 family protein [Flavobacterium]